MKTNKEPTGTLGQTGKSRSIVQWLMKYSGQLVFLILLMVVLSIISPVFLTKTNIINVLRQISTNLYMGCGMTMILITGGIDLSTGAVMAVAGMVATYMSVAGIPFIFCALGGIAAGLLVGTLCGWIISSTTLPPFIVTYTLQSICRGLVYVITGAATIRITSDAFLKFGSGFLGFLPLPVVYLLIVIVAVSLILNRTKLGRHMYAVGGNEKAAQYAGINIKRTRMFIYMASGVLSALAGLVLTSRNTSMQPTLGTGMEMDAIAAVVLGGTSMSGGLGAVGGTVIGALIIGFINNGLNLIGLDSFYQYIAKGAVILIAVYIDYVKNKAITQGKKN